MVKPNPADLRRKNKYEDVNNSSKVASEITSSVMKCEDCPGNGRFWIIPESYQVIKYTNFFTGEIKFHDEGKFFVKLPWRTHIEIFDFRPKLINPSVKQFKTSDGDTVDADFSLEYKVIDKRNYIMNLLSFDAKLTERIQSIMQQYFRNNDAQYIAKNVISKENVDENAFKQIEKDLGIMILSFNKTTLNLKNYDTEMARRTQQKLSLNTQMETLTLQQQVQGIQRELEIYKGETDNKVRAEHLQTIKGLLTDLPKDIQGSLLAKLYEIDKLAGNANVTYVSGAENLYSGFNNGKKR